MRILRVSATRFVLLLINKIESIMKKIFFCIVLVIISKVNLNAQEFRVGFNAGISTYDKSDITTALDISYLWNVSEKVNIGLTTGFSHLFGHFNITDVLSDPTHSFRENKLSTIPIAITNRFDISKKITLGIDLGYTIPIKKSYLDGGLYFSPKISYSTSKFMDFVLGYRTSKFDYLGTSTVKTDMLSFGLEFKL